MFLQLCSRVTIGFNYWYKASNFGEVASHLYHPQCSTDIYFIDPTKEEKQNSPRQNLNSGREDGRNVTKPFAWRANDSASSMSYFTILEWKIT